ncbi:OmpP1/FadL family transporter [Pedobacter foliorum]|uniref:OmpP1/FadL family transporter n=1 Tax=Pedobacter foliorum TaxID=2739058 RepID=UPI001567562C|nr:outer membrane protein transport protein [Pedobacter foliorum]NRF39442.1 outer membrane protein transport protein [Pedobacter foliorum]
MKKLILSLVATVAISGTTYAQIYSPDALKFSQTNYGSTSRFKSMGGAQIGVGGDMSSIGGNPAGLGLFTKSEFSLTPEFNNFSGNANFLNQNTQSSKDNLNLNHIGVVLFSPSIRVRGQDTQKGVVSSVFGIAYNRNNDFGGNFTYGGSNPNNSIVDHFAEEANANGLPNGSLQQYAYDGYLLDYDAVNKDYYAVTKVPNTQLKSEIRSGSTSELTASGAINISNQVYIGASVSLVNVRYVNDSEFTESGTIEPDNSKYSLSFRQNQESRGSGYNARLGVILRPVENFRIGATLQSPSWMLIEDNTTWTLDSKITGGANSGILNGNPQDYPFNYRVRTPLKGSLGASYVIAGKALISADVDYIDYSTIRFSTDQGLAPDRILDENNAIRANYKQAVNYRIGAEYKIDNAFSLRGGYGVNGSAIQGDKKEHFATQFYSGGLGYRVNNYYVDIAYQRMETNTELSPYLLGDNDNPLEPVADIKTSRNNIFLTLGLRF